MSAQAIERNYTKNPHTARFLQTFHSAIGSNGHNYRDDAAALAAEANQDADLLDLVPVDAVADLRSPAQRDLMGRLIREITDRDSETGAQARAYTDGMTEHGKWTPGREGNASAWISRMIAKADQLRRFAQIETRKTESTVEVADGRYAVEEDGVLKFFKVKNGGRPGFVFLDVQASDDWHAIRNVTRIREIVALIARDTEAASLRYGQEIGECGDCGRTLTTEASRARGRGPICDARH
jgi:hypothetical protein